MMSTQPRRPDRRWQVELALILLAALALRIVFFVGFGLGDDQGYLAHVDQILDGRYPPLDPLNQYAYRPVLLLLFAGGVGLFGYTDLGIVFPVLVASLSTTALVYAFVRILIARAAAWWCALVYACAPFDVVNSTTMTNDVILSALVFASATLFLCADRDIMARRSQLLFACAGVVLIAAFLVKMTILPALVAFGVYSAVRAWRGPRALARSHSFFYLSLLVCVGAILFVYYLLKGDPLWQFRSELLYYETYKPDWYLRGEIDYGYLMWQYPRSLFWLSGYGSFRYFEHGLLFWLFVPAGVWFAVRRVEGVLNFLIGMAVVTFIFLQFYPQHLTPRYLPLVRQERYFELLLPAVAIVVGIMFYRLAANRRVLAIALMAVVLADFVYEASRRSLLYRDSQQDVRQLAREAASVIPADKTLYVDLPARNALLHFLRGRPVTLDLIAGKQDADLRGSFVAVGGARSFWWARDMVFDVDPALVPSHWMLVSEIPGRRLPWRPSNMRLYYVGD